VTSGLDAMTAATSEFDNHAYAVWVKAMGLEPEVLYHEHKVLCSAPLAEIERKIPCLCTAERVFLLLRRENLTDEHSLLCQEGQPDYTELQRWALEADWATATEHMNRLHGRTGGSKLVKSKPQPAWRWHVDCRRRGPRGSRVRGVDNLVAKQRVREALHEVLDPMGIEHDSKAPTMTRVHGQSSSSSRPP